MATIVSGFDTCNASVLLQGGRIHCIAGVGTSSHCSDTAVVRRIHSSNPVARRLSSAVAGTYGRSEPPGSPRLPALRALTIYDLTQVAVRPAVAGGAGQAAGSKLRPGAGRRGHLGRRPWVRGSTDTVF